MQRKRHTTLIRLRGKRKEERGQVLVIGVIVIMALVMMGFSVVNIGLMVAEKINLQNTADAAAYSAAVVQARYMNLAAYINRAIVSNYNAMVFNLAAWSTQKSIDHGYSQVFTTMCLMEGALRETPLESVGRIVDELAHDWTIEHHDPLHLQLAEFNKWLHQEEDDLNGMIEIYNSEILSIYQALLYTAMQSARYHVVRRIANETDREILATNGLGLAAEMISANDLVMTVDYLVNDPSQRAEPTDELVQGFNSLFGADEEAEFVANTEEEFGDYFASGTDPCDYYWWGEDWRDCPRDMSADHGTLLAALVEASADPFSAGRFRDGTLTEERIFNRSNIIPRRDARQIKRTLDAICRVTCPPPPQPCNCDAQPFIATAGQPRYGQEEFFDQERVPATTRQRLRMADRFDMEIDLGPEIANAFSLEYPNVPLSSSYTSGEKKADIANIGNLLDPEDFDPDRAEICESNEEECRFNEGQIALSDLMSVWVDRTPGFDEHWDGGIIPGVAACLRLYDGNYCLDRLEEYVDQAAADGYDEGIPRYDFRADLDNVGFPHYNLTFDEAPPEERPRPELNFRGEPALLEGPTVAVGLTKRRELINNFVGLELGNPFDMYVISRAQVYYLRNANRPDERPNLFTPAWSARLAPIDSDSTPEAFRRGVPFVATRGIPYAPTH